MNRTLDQQPASTEEADGAVPAGYRLGDEWTAGARARSFLCSGCSPSQPAAYTRWAGTTLRASACPTCAIQAGALVPLSPPGELEVAPPVSEEDCGRKVESGMVMMCSPSCVEAGRHLRKVLSPAGPPGEGTVPVCNPVDEALEYARSESIRTGTPYVAPPASTMRPCTHAPRECPDDCDGDVDSSPAPVQVEAPRTCEAPAWCGTENVPEPQFRQQAVWWNALPDKRGFCSKECRDNSTPAPQPAEPAKVPLSEQIDRWSTTIGKRPTLTLHQCAERARALEAELAEAKRRDREECCQSYKRLVEGERDAASAEVEQLRKDRDAAIADRQVNSEWWKREADARVLAMRTECAKVARDEHCDDHCNHIDGCETARNIANAIERLPTSTGTASGAGGEVGK